MPKFVPVVDNEKSQAEQREDTNFDKHRRFDNPHKVDRGWQQGNVGWGVLGAFGSDSKDDAAQIIKRAEGSNKMIKNEKGLWVKAKELEEDAIQQSRPGRGRGGGVSVYDEMASRTMGSADIGRKNEPPRKGQYDDLGETHMKRSSKQNHVSADREDDRRKDDRYRDSNRRDERDRDTHSRSKRSPSRSPDRRRDNRGREDSRHGERAPRRDRSRSRSRSRSYDRNRHRDDRSDRHRDSRRSRSRSPARKESSRRDSRDRHDKRGRDDHTNKHRSPPRSKHSPERTHTLSEDSPEHKKKALSTELTAEEAALQAEMRNSITAVQVINRFHEVFSQDKLFLSERLSQIGQMFSPSAVIASLKSGVVHITGKTGVEDSFAKTAASVPAISKRIYVEQAANAANDAADTTTNSTRGIAEEGEETSDPAIAPKAPKVTFCLDFHRPGTAPGLGDRAKHTVLLYRCVSAQITHIWGMVDHEQLSQPEEMEQSCIMKSKVWTLVKPIVLKDIGAFDETRDAHFHNYDRMEVWGMF